jgi:hypothetical protein
LSLSSKGGCSPKCASSGILRGPGGQRGLIDLASEGQKPRFRQGRGNRQQLDGPHGTSRHQPANTLSDERPLTRARQAMVIYIPKGAAVDGTRPPTYYDGTADFLSACGLPST